LAREAEAFLSGGTGPTSEDLDAAAADGAIAAPKVLSRVETAIRDQGKRPPADRGFTDGLIVLASIDEVIRYLHKHHTVVPSDEQDHYLVDDQMRETTGQLLERANRLRRSEELPTFTLMPTAGTAARPAPANSKTIPAKRATEEGIGGKITQAVVLAPWQGCDADGRPLAAGHPRFN
jgi:hypothetical protein